MGFEYQFEGDIVDIKRAVHEILYYHQLEEWRRYEPHMTTMCSISLAKMEHDHWMDWVSMKPIKREV
jgi:hypothetical protein